MTRSYSVSGTEKTSVQVEKYDNILFRHHTASLEVPAGEILKHRKMHRDPLVGLHYNKKQVKTTSLPRQLRVSADYGNNIALTATLTEQNGS